MPSERVIYALELFTRLVGVVLAAVGLLFVPSIPIFGAFLILAGLLFALKPAVAVELVDVAAALV